jgi:hypothetical protein
MQLSDFIGQSIIVVIPAIDREKFQTVRLLGVEIGGIWIESQAINGHMLKAFNAGAMSESPRAFFPYSQITFALVGGGPPALDEKAFGL